MPPLPVATGVWPKDSVKDVAESCGIANLPDEVCAALAADVEYRLHEIIEESLKFMRNSKREKLKVEDVDYALKVRNIEPLWGFTSSDTFSFRKTTTATGNLYFLDDEEVDLTKVLATQLPPIPRDVSYTAHWLAIEGVQPAIPQNPTPAELRAISSPSTLRTIPSPSFNTTTSPNVEVKPQVKHVLSRELQLYFERVTSAATDQDEAMREAALASLRGDPGLHQLVPYLVQWVAESVTVSLSEPLVLEQMLSVLQALLDNPSLFVDPYLHQVLPAILTCLLSASIGPLHQPTSLSYEPPDFAIRNHASSLLSLTLRKYTTSYTSLRPRVFSTLMRALVAPPSSSDDAQSRTVGTRYGAIRGLEAMGKEAVKVSLGVPGNLKLLGESLETMRDRWRREVQMCVDVAIDAILSAFSLTDRASPESATSDHMSTDEEQQTLRDKFGGLFGAELSGRGRKGLELAREMERPASNGSGTEEEEKGGKDGKAGNLPNGKADAGRGDEEVQRLSGSGADAAQGRKMDEDDDYEFGNGNGDGSGADDGGDGDASMGS